jgi:hypothetical protein
MFISVSILVSFDHTHMMVMKTDFSGWCIGETLLQLMNDVWRPYAYYSKKNASAKCNYEIYDKEMLIIIWCLKQWDTEFKSVSSFQICTDHKNLKYFMTVKKAYRVTNEMVFDSVVIQLLHTILAEQAEWESKCFIETRAECVNESLRWQSTTLYDTNNTF